MLTSDPTPVAPTAPDPWNKPQTAEDRSSRSSATPASARSTTQRQADGLAAFAAHIAMEAPADFRDVPAPVTGKIPTALTGTIYRNGPGGRTLFNRKVSHSFEGDGVVAALNLQGHHTQATTSVVTIASAGLKEEQAAGRRLYGDSAGWLRRIRNQLGGRGKNTANTSVMFWQGRLFGLMEGGKPTELDPAKLTTLGESSLDDIIVGAFSAHPHRVHAHNASYNIGIEYGRVTKTHLYRLPDTGKATKIATIAIPFATMIHDFIVTERHAVIMVAPIVLSVPRMMLQIGDFASMWQWQAQRGNLFFVVDLANPANITRIEAEAFQVWHYANGWSPSTNEVVFDCVRYSDYDSFTALAGAASSEIQLDPSKVGYLYRCTLDLTSKRLRSELIASDSCEFPQVDPRQAGARHQTVYAAGGYGESILSVHADGTGDRYDMQAHEFATEPLFIPKLDQDGGYLVSLVWNRSSGVSSWQIFDANALRTGPCATINSPQPLHFTFHGVWKAH